MVPPGHLAAEAQGSTHAVKTLCERACWQSNTQLSPAHAAEEIKEEGEKNWESEFCNNCLAQHW